MIEVLKQSIFNINSDADFESCALEIFRFQFLNNPVYKQFVNALKVDVAAVKTVQSIPFLPISFFKTSRVSCSAEQCDVVFTSSGTTGPTTSSHYVQDKELYEASYLKSFTYFYGNPEEYCFLALLPSYSERLGSSLIYMVDDFIHRSRNASSGYFLNADEKLKDTLVELSDTKQKTILFGVTYALLDFAEKYKIDISNCIVLETGGMKGRRKELVREEILILFYFYVTMWLYFLIIYNLNGSIITFLS